MKVQKFILENSYYYASLRGFIKFFLILNPLVTLFMYQT